MQVREAKDFLVAQTAQQAALEGVPLSDVEKRMTYFTEGKDAIEDPSTLNDQFEAQCDTAKYEKKISRLMRHAYSRVKRENSEKALQWNRAIRTLRRGDHYILVLWGHPLSHNSPRDWAIFLVVGLPIVAYWLFAFFFLPRRNGSWPYSNYIPHVNPHIMQALFLSLIIVAIFFPQILLKPADWWFGLLDRFIDPRKTHGQAE